MDRPGFPKKQEDKRDKIPSLSNDKKEVDIIIVSNKPMHQLQMLIVDINRTIEPKKHRIVYTGQDGSASYNRNIGLNQVTADYVIMLDDDMDGFYKGWVDDMVRPLKKRRAGYEEVMIVSANLRKPDLRPAPAMGCDDLDREVEGIFEVLEHDFGGYQRVPTACVSFKRNALRFDEGFIGSGAEDTAWCNLMNMIYPDKCVVMNMDCHLIHKNYMQNQGGHYARHNRQHYNQLFPEDRWTFK